MYIFQIAVLKFWIINTELSYFKLSKLVFTEMYWSVFQKETVYIVKHCGYTLDNKSIVSTRITVVFDDGTFD